MFFFVTRFSTPLVPLKANVRLQQTCGHGKAKLKKKRVSRPDFFEKEKERALFFPTIFLLLSTKCLLDKSLPFPGISWTEFVGLILINETADIFILFFKHKFGLTK